MMTERSAATLRSSAPAPDSGAWSGVRWALSRDLKLALRSRAELGVQLLFYVIVVSLFPLATTPEKNQLALMGPGVLWVAALLASLLSLPRLFASDHADGTLEQLVLGPAPLPARVSLLSVAGALVLGAVVGVVFGVAPAARAAKLDPVEALRAET
jgi:heme exporter protein B